MSQRFLASCLRVEIDGANKQWLESRPAMSAACEKFDAMLDDVARRYGASRQERLERGAILAFIDPLASIEAAAALIFSVSKELWTTRKPIRIKVAVRTGLIETRRNGVGGQIVDLCAAQLERTVTGRATVCETTRNLLHGELPPDIEIEDFGRVQIDSCRPAERLFVLRIAGVAEGTERLCTTSGCNHNIPARLTSFVGREDDLEELERRVRSARFLTIVGPGGSGKTSLSRELARRFALEMPDGAWFVALADVVDEAGIYRAVVDSLRELVAAPGAFEAAILHEIGDRSILLVLDNIEQVLRPASRFIHKVLTFCPNVRIVATSRQSTGVAGEQVHPIAPFSLADVVSSSSVADLIRNPAVRLFSDRALAVDPRFALTEDNAASVLAICRRVEGLPLAIEQAALNIHRLSLAQIERTLETSVLALRHRGGNVEPRHATMRATVQWSLDLLSPTARQLASALLSFVGGWTIESCTAVAKRALGVSDEEALEAHGELVDASIAIRAPTGTEPRFRFSEAFREALLEIDPPSEAALGARAQYFFLLARNSDVELVGAHQADWIRRLEQDDHNLRHSLEFYWEHEISAAPEFICAMRRYWLRSRRHEEAIRWLENGLSVTGSDRLELRAHMLNALGACHFRIGQHDYAERYYQECRDIWEKTGSSCNVAAVLTNLAMCKVEKGEWAEAIELSNGSCRHYELAHDVRGLGSALMNMGYFQAQMGDLDGAEATLGRASEFLASSNHQSHYCLALANLSFVAWKRGDRQEYCTLLDRQIELIERTHDGASLEAMALGMATCAKELGLVEAVRATLSLLHNHLGPNPSFGQRLHEDQYRAAMLFVGGSAVPRKLEADAPIDWHASLSVAREIAQVFEGCEHIATT